MLRYYTRLSRLSSLLLVIQRTFAGLSPRVLPNHSPQVVSRLPSHPPIPARRFVSLAGYHPMGLKFPTRQTTNPPVSFYFGVPKMGLVGVLDVSRYSTSGLFLTNNFGHCWKLCYEIVLEVLLRRISDGKGTFTLPCFPLSLDAMQV